MTEPGNRRARLRAELARDLKHTTRGLLVSGGLEAVTLTSIARELGITAPAIYRYYHSREELVLALATDLVTELVDELHQVAGSYPEAEPERRIVAMVRAFPAWAGRNRAEFGLLFGSPPPMGESVHTEIVREWVRRLATTYGEPFQRVWHSKPFPVPAETELDPALREQLAGYRQAIGLNLPLGAVLTFLECWSRIYASTCLEVFAHLSIMMTDMRPMHERMCQSICALLEIPYEPPSGNGDPLGDSG